MGVSIMIKEGRPGRMFNEENAPYFRDLPEWLQEDIIRENSVRLDALRKRVQRKQEEVEKITNRRGYDLNPTRGEMTWPYTRRKSRRSVGDFSLMEYD
jgi:hypothetical protein